MTTETMEIRQLARQFAETELRPHVEKWDHDAAYDASINGELAELGFFGMLIPESFGGMEFDAPTFVSAIEEIAWGEPAVAWTVAISSAVSSMIVAHGSDEQKRRWLERMALGEIIACLAAAEEDGEIRTAATRDGDGWIINGTKTWVTNGRNAHVALVLASAEQGMTTFLVPTDASGYSVTARSATLGFRPVELVTIELKDVRVDADALLSVPLEDIVPSSDMGRLATAAIAVGISQAAFEHARGYADVREQFKTKLRNFEGIQYKLADMAMRTEAARALLQVAANEPRLMTSAMAKVFASETAMWVTTQAVQVYGGYGYMRDYPVEKLMRDAKATEIIEGANEVQRVLIAQNLYNQD